MNTDYYIYLAHFKSFWSQLYHYHHKLHLDSCIKKYYQITQINLRCLNNTRGGIQGKYKTTSEKRTTSEERTKIAVPKCPLFGGSTVVTFGLKTSLHVIDVDLSD